ncbi:MAG: single-stranded DNA-binding protein [Rickettsiales bacterium]|nr:single-stranded DNA-binding protein [Rickettsiales bacterium]
MNFNSIQIAGHLGRNADVGKNGEYCTFSLAVTEWKKSDNGFESTVDWFNVLVGGNTFKFSKAGELKKGDNVFVTGKLKTKEYTDREGVKKTSYTIIADKIIQINKKDEGTKTTTTTKTTNQDANFVEDVNDDEIPF